MFRTEVQLTPAKTKITLADNLFTIGSCFSDTIGTKLTQHKFNVLVNPFGTNYNPYSIHKSLAYTIHNQPPSPHTYIESQGVIHNYDFHTSFSELQQRGIEKKITDAIGTAHYHVKNTHYILLTYGTAWVFERIDTGEIVANCHKVPAHHFKKSLLSQKKIIDSFDSLYKELKVFNPNCKIIATVSPVRHLKETLSLNSVSKAVLRVACQTIIETYADVYYFPAFEIMMDDLRDYRFYKPDMLHPSEEAEEYIWNKFASCYFDKDTQQFIKQWSHIRTALSHKPFHPQTQAHQNFLRSTLQELQALRATVNVDAEIKFIESQLI